MTREMCRFGALMIAATFVLALAPCQVRAQDGAQIFKTNCTVCHSAEPGQSKIGPPLFGVVGRKAGTAPNYTYSGAMKDFGPDLDAGPARNLSRQSHGRRAQHQDVVRGIEKRRRQKSADRLSGDA